ncbi:leucine-rich repeat protein [Ruminococcus bromii]|uniref:leucine-rich repeat protein n=1 Tax=Ruminococcus bromii TaxID=40518 RepID=UPI00399ACDE2
MKTIKRTLVLLLSLVLASNICIFTVSAKSKSYTWNIDKNGTLYINGSGIINENEESYDEDGIPWFGVRSKIKKVVVGNGITEIGNYAFWDCANLESIEIPASVTYIGVFNFLLDTNLKRINVDGNNKHYSSVDGVLFSKDKKSIIKYPNKKQNTYSIPNTVTNISSYAFRDDTNLEYISLPKNVTSVDYGAFIDCPNLIKVTLPRELTDIASDAFGYLFRMGGNVSVNGFKIYGYKGTAAETYAKNNSFKFVALSNNLPTPSISSLKNTTGGIKLAWKKVDGVYGYRLYQKTSNSWKRIKDTTATSFTDSAVSANQTKTYTIRCINKNGKTISGYNSKGWSKKYTPVAPTISKLENTAGGIKLTWNKITGVYGYRVYAKTSSGWKKLKDTTATNLTDSIVSANQTKTYTIRCIDKNGKTVSGFNSKGWSKKYTATTPKITKLTNTSKGVSVTWNKIAGVYGYRLYQKTSNGWKRIKDTTATSFTDSAVSANQTKIYTIRCIDKNGKTVSGFNSKGWSKKYTATTPKITKLTNTSKGVSVTWNKIAGAYGYRLYRKYDGGSWTKVKDTTSTSFTDSGAKKGKKVTYTVRCIDRKGKTVSGFNSKGWSITRK